MICLATSQLLSFFRWLVIAILAAGLAGCVHSKAGVNGIQTLTGSAPWGTSMTEITTVELPPPAENSDESVRSASGSPLQIGMARSILKTATTTATASLLKWHDLPNGGKLAKIRFRSLGASGIRLGIEVIEIPSGTIFRFSSYGSRVALVVQGQDIQKLVQTNLNAGDGGIDARTYWSPDLGDNEVNVEIEIAAGVNPASLQISVPRLSHIRKFNRMSPSIPPKIGSIEHAHPQSPV